MSSRIATDDIDVLCLARGCERYIILSNANQRAEVLKQLARWTADPELSFSGLDCANMIRKIVADDRRVYNTECEWM